MSEIPPAPQCGAIDAGDPDQPDMAFEFHRCTREPGHAGPHDDNEPGANPDFVWVW